TLLSYTAKAEIGGKLAQLGSRLVTGTARKLAAQFFATFSNEVAERQSVQTLGQAPESAERQ
ncbi:SRPBCC domain-containing protein, partial [Klebsiella pneumoniae]